MIHYDNLSQKERLALETEKLLVEKLERLKESQASFELWDGFRMDKGFVDEIKIAEENLRIFTEENLEYLI
jgi:hypothetical protein